MGGLANIWGPAPPPGPNVEQPLITIAANKHKSFTVAILLFYESALESKRVRAFLEMSIALAAVL